LSASPSSEEPRPEEHGAKIVLLSADAGLAASLESVLTPEGHSLVRLDRHEQVLAVLDGGTVDMAMIDLAAASAPSVAGMQALHKAADAAIIVCLSEDPEGAREKDILRSGAVKCLARPPERDELLEEIRRFADLAAHRRGLAACEGGDVECALKKPVHERSHGKVRRRIAVAAVAVIIAAILSVPVIMLLMRSAANTAREANKKLDSIDEIKGFLQRDEQRELESRAR